LLNVANNWLLIRLVMAKQLIGFCGLITKINMDIKLSIMGSIEEKALEK